MGKLNFKKVICPFCNSMEAQLRHQDPCSCDQTQLLKHKDHLHSHGKCLDCGEEWMVILPQEPQERRVEPDSLIKHLMG